ncbi:MAG: sterol desaturase family protein [Opitutae bacterium]|nr:sterol desaturase family protein [Opitutae bacterium]MBT4666723.1 sterol desaturase family protein [Opitutae bacterium]
MKEEVELRFGKGLVSGYSSAILGVLCLCGVLCFRFPELLTSVRFRASYTQEFVRDLLFWGLVAAYFLGIVSYALNHSKVLAWIGIVTALIASLLGGARIELSPFESTPYSFGLDFFAIGFLFSMLIFIPIEKAFAIRKGQKILREGWRTDLMYFFVSHLFIQFIFLWTNAFSDIAFAWAATEDLHSFIRSLPIWAQFIMAIFLADLFQYWAHRIHHHAGFLWKFHSIHHSSHSMDWLAGSRTHVVEIFMIRALVMLPLYVCGFSEAALNSYIILIGVQSVAIHANLGVNFGFLRYILVTPQFHHWHHAKDAEYWDANYAVHLPVIDMIFGTYRCPKGKWPEEYGVISGEPPPSFWKQLVHPFRRSRSQK